ncbi:MAG: M48 family metalloprotease [Patescibacteria group bacterium]|nr:M48 family metalloprotease [Patescibacteria group bacterium]
MPTIYREIAENKRKSILLVAVFIFLITALGYVFGYVFGYGQGLIIFAFVFSVLASLGSFYYSDKIVLAVSGAREVLPLENPTLHNLVEAVAIGAGLPKPRVFMINDPAMNAFATGRDPQHAVVCYTSGIVERLDRVELEGVTAHELSHIKNYDVRYMALVAVLAGMITLLSDWFLQSLWWGGRRRDDREEGQAGAVIFLIAVVLALLSPLFATLIQLAVSRKRELLADADGVLVTRFPEGLASALEKLKGDSRPLSVANKATAHLYIVNPFKGKNLSGWFAGLFDTHPPLEERIKILRSM